MGRYEGLDEALRLAVLTRDRFRCRWCGRGPDIRLDPHHIRYRRGAVDDTENNLIALCRQCHDFVHGRIAKVDAQTILWYLVDMPGLLGMALLRKARADADFLDAIREGRVELSAFDRRRLAQAHSPGVRELPGKLGAQRR